MTSEEEQRPISLVGYSFGASVVVSCLAELAKHQVYWEEQQHQQQRDNDFTNHSSSKEDTTNNKNKKNKLSTRWKRWQESRQQQQQKSQKRSSSLALAQYAREPASIIDDVVVMGLPENTASINPTCRD